MSPGEHYLEAERLMRLVDDEEQLPEHEIPIVARAQVHALLAAASFGWQQAPHPPLVPRRPPPPRPNPSDPT